MADLDIELDFDLNEFKAEKDLEQGAEKNTIHIRVHQRVGRKHITTVNGISDEFDQKKMVKAWKKLFSCNGAIIEHIESGLIIQLSGDQRNAIQKFLIEEGIAKAEQIKIHGAM